MSILDPFWYDDRLTDMLKDADVNIEQCTTEDDEKTVEVNIEVTPVDAYTEQFFTDRTAFANHTQSTTPSTLVADEVETALKLIFSDLPHRNGAYTQANEGWKKHNTDELYEEYKDLLKEITEEYTPELSIPTLKPEVIEAIAESDTHQTPNTPLLIDEIISEHIDHLRETEQARLASRELKRELENNGLSARGAARIAKQIEGKDLLKPDSEVKAMKEENRNNE